ncbi:UDP-glucose 4-epimerase GalE [Natronospira bacteriovora]|uniref:UDP-glucose 4-epimerase n=1 Tax=Natronospira bacteriovora TaxID=3069753 RepID=A0ABU0W855_9GAMM|nr:UDP-glucose 4-epimerase GalE [Natronospira sp. AB-CW4]MDQ2070142.1 UDP-glucose 4-epimerase GalE [Natronospira sp. AB-CW4]
MGTVLVTGGAGYIGSHNVKYLLERGHDVLVLDDLSGGFRDAVPDRLLIEGNIGDIRLLDKVFTEHRIDAVMNFASFIEVGASVKDPSSYFRNNLGNTLVLLDAMVRHGVKKLVFSSTAAIFGDPEYTPIDEAHPKAPINPYGRSKWLVEQLLTDYASAYGLQSVCLRYFNAAGADPDGELGERHEPETHLIPIVLQAASGRRESIAIFGEDYDTEDGTCVRDYIHVRDLAQAHWLALEYLEAHGRSAAFNLGNGNGYSIREVIETARRVTGRDFPVESGPRRAGDPAVLVADSRLAREELGWRPEHAELEEIIRHAWAWEQQKGKRW